jgi:tetratricopeptide (TPR) repeat protein
MRKLLLIFAFLIITCPVHCRIQPEAYRSVIDSGITLSLEQRYTDCFDLFKRNASGHPGRVLAPFYTLMNYEAMMIDYETTDWESVYDSLSLLSEALLNAEIKRDRNDAWAHYFLGTLFVTRGAHALRFSHYLNFTTEVLKGIQLIKKSVALDSTLMDACLYLGLYQYARAELFSWLPLLGDEKNEAVELIEKAARYSLFSREVATQVLVGIYGRSGELEKAAVIAAEFKVHHPSNRAIYWLIGNVYLSQKKYRDAQKEFVTLKSMITNIPAKYAYNYISLDASLARCHYELGELDACIALCDNILARKDADKRIKELQSVAERLRKKADRMKRKTP